MSEHTIPQKAAVLAYLKQGYSITPMQALDMFHVNCLVVLTILAAQRGLNRRCMGGNKRPQRANGRRYIY